MGAGWYQEMAGNFSGGVGRGGLRHHFRVNIYLPNLFLSHLYMTAQHRVFWAWGVISLVQSTLMGFGVLFPPLYLLSGYLGSLGWIQLHRPVKRVGESYIIIVSKISKYIINSFFFPVKKELSCLEDPGSVRPQGSDSNIYHRFASSLWHF